MPGRGQGGSPRNAWRFSAHAGGSWNTVRVYAQRWPQPTGGPCTQCPNAGFPRGLTLYPMAGGMDNLRMRPRTSWLGTFSNPQQLPNTPWMPRDPQTHHVSWKAQVFNALSQVPSCWCYFGKLRKPAGSTWVLEADHILWVPGHFSPLFLGWL